MHSVSAVWRCYTFANIIDDYPVSQYADGIILFGIYSVGVYINPHLKHHVANVGLTVYCFSYNILSRPPMQMRVMSSITSGKLRVIRP